ncbi:MAG: hypothetical protein O2780_10800 [Proteobacteria bacterium]|jgi:hypothetical protein|nr:hypothetical protein [Pseudomonadota bacterium]MDA1301399.1 hypothetical protein [Pseudomonadota bacterium]
MSSLEEQISEVIAAYSSQGNHRTGTDVDHSSAEWLAATASELGCATEIVEFGFNRLVVDDATLTVGELSIDGVPLFDSEIPDDPVISGKLGVLGSDAEIAIHMSRPTAQPDVLAARREDRHRAIVLVTDERMPSGGVAAVNGDAYAAPFGPPVLQVSSDHWATLQECMRSGTAARLSIRMSRLPGTASNVEVRLPGLNPSLSPVVVMTPRSGWWRCASERGGGLVCWLQTLGDLLHTPVTRSFVFTANSGHELGHLGLDHFIECNPGLAQEAFAWIHLGANFAARGSDVRVQCSDDAMVGLLNDAMAVEGARPVTRTTPGERPRGEASNVFDMGGRYVSIIGGNPLFHHPADVFPDAVDVARTAQWTRVFVRTARALGGYGDTRHAKGLGS